VTISGIKNSIVNSILLLCKEYKIEDNKNALFYNKDNSNALEIAKKMTKPLKFSFKKIEDGYNDILYKSKSYYEEEKKMLFKVRATDKYTRTDTADAKLSEEESMKALKEVRVVPEEGREWIVTAERKDVLVNNGFVEVIEEIKEEAPVTDEIKVLEPEENKKEIEKTSNIEEKQENSSGEDVTEEKTKEENKTTKIEDNKKKAKK